MQTCVLKNDHVYFTYIHGQMAVVGRDWCDFIVHTPQKQLIQRVTFDEEFWEEYQARGIMRLWTYQAMFKLLLSSEENLA